MNPETDVMLRLLLQHLWESTLFGLVVCAFIIGAPGLPARYRHLAGCLACVRFLVPAPLLGPLTQSLQLDALRPSWLDTSLGALSLPAYLVQDQAPGLPSTLPNLLLVVWMLPALLLLIASAHRQHSGLRAVTGCMKPLDEAGRRRLEALATRLALAPGSVSGYTVPSSSWLGVTGFFRSRVIIPEGLFSALEDREVNSLLLHELMHVKRRDNLLRLFQSVMVALLWFHPLVWWLDRRLRWESEVACDEGVLRLTGAGQAYASGLYKATRFALGVNLPGVSGMSRHRLHKRIRAVLNHQPRKESPMKRALFVSTLVGAFGLATLASATPELNSGTPSVSTSAGTTEHLYSINELDQKPAAIKQVPPLFPAELKKAGIKAEVIAAFVVDEQGEVTHIKIQKSTDPRCEQPVIEALRQWKFTPGSKDGRAVKVALQVPIVFSLQPVH